MSLFQAAGFGFAFAIVLALVWSVVRGRTSPRTAVPWMCLWGVTSVAFAWPEATAILARRLGVRRGADLISYLAVLGTLAGFFLMSIRIRQLNRHVTLLVRQMALFHAAPGQTEAFGDEADDSRGDEREEERAAQSLQPSSQP